MTTAHYSFARFLAFLREYRDIRSCGHSRRIAWETAKRIAFYDTPF